MARDGTTGSQRLAFTQRQYDYAKRFHLASAYTPQMVVDGHLQTVGGNAPAIQKLIAEAAHAPKTAAVTLNFVAPGKLQISVTDSSNAKQRVLLAVTEDNLTTKVGGGENGGRVLVHSAVVRELRTLGTLSNGKFEKTVSVPDKQDWKRDDLRADRTGSGRQRRRHPRSGEPALRRPHSIRRRTLVRPAFARRRCKTSPSQMHWTGDNYPPLKC